MVAGWLENIYNVGTWPFESILSSYWKGLSEKLVYLPAVIQQIVLSHKINCVVGFAAMQINIQVFENISQNITWFRRCKYLL